MSNRVQPFLDPFDGDSPVVPHEVAQPGGVKTLGDYLRALRRRCWLVVGITLLIGVCGAVVTFKQAPIFLAKERIQIEPPRATSLTSAGDPQAIMTPRDDMYLTTQMELITSQKVA